MILTIAITCLSIGNLFLLNSLRSYSREIFWIALMNGIYIIQAAHLLFDGISVSPDDHPLMVNAVFTTLYFPALGILYCYLHSRTNRIKYFLYAGAFIAALFAPLYYKIFIEGSMPVMSYANLIWSVEIILIVVLVYEFSGGAGTNDALASSLTRSYRSLSKIWCAIIIAPYLVGLAAVMFPPDNYFISYKPLMTTQDAIQTATCGLLLRFLFAILHHKHVIDKQRSANAMTGKFKDLAY